MRSRSPSSKRIKLENELVLSTYKDLEGVEIPKLEEEPDQKDSEDSCSICLHSIVDRTVIPKCSHEFCFECLLIWTEQSRRCPLCSQAIGEYVIHSIRSRYDYRKHFIPPLRTSPPPFRPAQTNAILQTTRQRRRDREWGTRARESDEADKLERSIAKRRWIYRHDLYVKHVASNPYTKYRPYPTPAQFAASQELISRMTTFLRRELQIWEGLDVEFLTTLIISLMKSIDIRSESAVKLISEFLDMDAPYTPGGRHVNAEHFAHEVYSYARSPYRDLFVYDTVAQYDTPSHLPQPTDIERSHRWYEPPPIRNEPSLDGRHHSQKRSRSNSSERSTSWSPSGRKYSPTRKMGGPSHQKTPISSGNSRSPCDIPNPWDRRLQNADSGHIGRQHQSANTSQTPVASSSNERGKEMSIFSRERDLKGKRKVDGIGMTTSLSGGPDLKIVDSNFGQPPLETEEANERDDRPRNMKPIKIFRAPRNRTLLDSVKAHLAVHGESAQRNRADSSSSNPQISSNIIFQTGDPPVPSLLTRLSDPTYVPAANSTGARNMSDDCQQIAGDYDKDKDPGQNLSYHHHIDDSSNTSSFRRQQRQQSSSSRSQDGMQIGPYCSTTEVKEKPISSKNNDVTLSTNVINQLPISSASPIPCQNNTAITTVENRTAAIPPYQYILSRSLPVLNNSQEQVDNDIDAVGSLNLPNQFPPLPHSTSLNSVETRTRLLARLEIEKRQVVQLSAADNNKQFDDGPSCSSSFTVSKKSLPGVLDLASDLTVSEESRKNESKLRARAQLRIRLAAEKTACGLM